MPNALPGHFSWENNVADHALAAGLATEAGVLLQRLRAERGFADPRALREAGDQGSHDYLVAELTAHRPGDSVLSEEGLDDSVRLCGDRVWIVDPLDGTREFGEEDRTDWAVHVALWEQGRLTAGAVALPALGKTLSTAAGGAEIIEDHAISRSRLHIGDLTEVGTIKVAVSRTRPPEFLQRLAGHLAADGVDMEFVPIGSAGAKISAVLLGEVDAYIHAGGQYEWDSAAPVAVALAAGAHASRIDGTPLEYNQKDPKLPDILVCHPDLARTLLAGIRTVTETQQIDVERKS
jgi:3'(2'), 5'-bisphosphate nucleotidase